MNAQPLNRPMARAYKNADAVTPQERIELSRRESDKRPNWAAVAAVLALACLAYENVAHRDEVVRLKEQHAAALAKKDREIALYKPEPQKQACKDYAVHMEGFGVTWCRKPGIRM